MKKFLTSLVIIGMIITIVSSNACATDTAPPTRLAGTTAAQTAVAIADQLGWTGTAIIASSAPYGTSDALAAGPLATFLKAPILLQEPGNALNVDTKAELIKLKVTKVYVTSGNTVISQAVLDQLAGMGITIESLGGADRIETSVNIANKLISLGAPVTKIAVVNGWQNQDALSIASIASFSNEPIILTQKTGLSTAAKGFLDANTGIITSDVIGGTGVIDNQVLAQLPNPTRHAGVTAYDTNYQIIQDFVSAIDFNNVFLANGETGIDALSGAPLAAQTKSAIILTDGTPLDSDNLLIKISLNNLRNTNLVIAIGGNTVVPEEIRTSMYWGKAK
ncbi:cell wall-binding repeat-containing protein [Desulfosporosinus sp. FKA]|uniref:cell wall-binding repeat-containing protein n=1 Tax=Desulfosporosinus sp. FKA TaxID=1969834 RepID=UPI000B4A2CBF|nr:cell wall-binding repeat-containing protein [Desulfosporosinus sp. FKA]